MATKSIKPKLRAQEIPSAVTSRYRGTRKGRFVPAHPEKYEGNIDQIYYRSKMELRMMKHLDSHPGVLKWSSEETIIPYIKPTDNKVHKYYVDFKVTVKKKDGTIRTCLIECKWSTALLPPKEPKRKTRRYFAEKVNWIVNQAKWQEAKKVCEKKGWDWVILTEKQLAF